MEGIKQFYYFGHDLQKAIKQAVSSAGPALLVVLGFLSTCQGVELIVLGEGLTAAVVVNTLYRLLKNKLGEGLQGWRF